MTRREYKSLVEALRQSKPKGSPDIGYALCLAQWVVGCHYIANALRDSATNGFNRVQFLIDCGATKL